ncbi:hypothetical protein glysoja_037042 [Glycine soja]|uniref:Transcription repressor n=1 Tax=Glycine soja TaxID=3848 RepID=A0A0B2PHQ0_GLYSO|nr:hypothetical protein glysoja_037042 [Glycine soja]
MKFFNLLKSRHVRSSSSSSSRAWPSCHQPKTLSFRVTTTKINNEEDNNNNNNVVNDVVLKDINSALVSQTPESFFTESPDSASFSTTSELSRGMDPIEAVIRGLRSDRLFFDRDDASFMLEGKPTTTTSLEPFKNSVVLTMDSEDPHVDFRKSMEEMVETLGVEDWESLEDLLCWYLQANTKSNHEYIIGAFVDLLFDLAVPNSPCSQDDDENLHSHSHSRPSSPLSFYNSSSSPSSSCSTPYCIKGEVEEEEVGACSSFFSLAQLNN